MPSKRFPPAPLFVLLACFPACSGKGGGGGGDGSGDGDDSSPEGCADVAEICDDLDNNCNGQIDEGLAFTQYADYDHDGYGDSENSFARCELQEGFTTEGSDCDDHSDLSFPGGKEVCDGHDNDCDGNVDNEVGPFWGIDTDGDGWGVGADVQGCTAPKGYGIDGDCDDADAVVHPGADETCDDEIDADCDDNDGFCDIVLSTASFAQYTGENGADYVGFESAGVGDLDGDGLDDIAVTAAAYPNFTLNGAVYVIAGPPSKGSQDIGASATAKIVGAAGNDGFGDAGIGRAGDLDGDGLDDLAVGSLNWNNAPTTLSYFYGPVVGDIDLSVTSPDVTIDCPGFIAAVTSQPVGDVTGDGVDDFVFGDYAIDTVVILDGPLTGDTDTAGAVVVTGPDAGVGFGFAVSGAGDVDGDGTNEVLATAVGADTYGAAYVIGGGASSGSIDDQAIATWYGHPTSAAIGYGAASVGDWNDDGYADYAFTDPGDFTYVNPKGGFAGAVFVVHGPGTGTHTVDDADAMVSGSEGYETLMYLDAGDWTGDGKQDLMIVGVTMAGFNGGALVVPGPVEGTVFTGGYTLLPSDTFGDMSFNYASVGSAGDMDDDGDDEMIVGAAIWPDKTAQGIESIVLGNSF